MTSASIAESFRVSKKYLAGTKVLAFRREAVLPNNPNIASAIKEIIDMTVVSAKYTAIDPRILCPGIN